MINLSICRAFVCTVMVFGFLASGQSAQAQSEGEIVEADVQRRDLDVAAIDTEDFELTGFLGYMNVEDFDSDAVWGFRLAYHINPKFFTELSYGKVDTGTSSSERATGVDPLEGGSRELEYYDLSLGWNVLPGEVFVGPGKSWNSALYLIGGFGNAELADDNENAFNLGFGFRVLPSDGFSVRLDFRNYMFDSSYTGKNKTTNNLQATLNVGWYF